jgi:hypothetical protein
MRIVKMSTEEFDTVDEIVSYFEEELPERGGKFRIPAGWIAEDGLKKGEPMFFSYQGTVFYSAKADCGRRDNHDEFSDKYPFYLQIDVETICRVQLSLDELEEKLLATGRKESIVHSQGWPTMPDSPERDKLWSSLRGE